MINAQRLKMARESCGFSQTELTELAALPTTSVSKAERGELGLSQESLAKIAQATGYPVSFFMAPGTVAPDAIAWRKREKVAVKTFATINARVNIMRLHVQAITRDLGIETRVHPGMELSDTYRPRDVVRELRQQWNLPEEPIANLTLTLETNQIPVIAFDFGTDRVDSRAAITDDHYPLICVNSRQPGDRQRFSLAYQLGHLLMHMYRPIREDQDTSREANHFAAELLMPERAIREDIGDKTITLTVLSNLKRKWQVSMIALLYRADDLGYLTEDQKKTLIQQFNQLGMRRREPVELDVPIEQPRLIRSWLSWLKKKERLSNINLAARLHMSMPEFAELFFEG
jgi:Zn-dependent peptidase ImmA (M78 family)/DNA-binding XRE family transcriptional regulator